VTEVARIPQGEQPDVILADIHIPVRDIRGALSSCPPVIVISARDEREEDREASDWDGFLLKPVDAGLLQAMLHRVLRRPDRRQSPR